MRAVRVTVVSSLLLGFVFCFARAAESAPLAEDTSFHGYPVRNGDFSVPGHGWQPAAWRFHTFGGEYELSMNYDIEKESPPQAAIASVTPGRACIFQDVSLLEGRYRLTVRAHSSQAQQAVVEVAGNSVGTTRAGEWQTLTVEFETKDTARIHLSASGQGTCTFREVLVTPLRLPSGPVPMDCGSVLGGIVLKEPSNPAAQFAVWELQRCITQMTGITPGLEGRDEVSPGWRLVVGGPCDTAHADAAPDSYRVAASDNTVRLTGNTPTGTLYAAYDYLRTQGCGWYMPGAKGEVIPSRGTLTLIPTDRLETPDYLARGIQIAYQEFMLSGGWLPADEDMYFDWAVRNRMNAVWLAYGETADLGEHRGGGFRQTLNHSWSDFFDEEHPEWYVLHEGERVELHSSGRPNQLCVSNADLRNHVTKRILQFFKDHPDWSVFALNAMDEPCYWCECAACRALDGDAGKGDWSCAPGGTPSIPTTDRVLNFVNDIAQRVAKSYPDKCIETYVYGSYRTPPERETVHPNVLLKYTLWPGQVVPNQRVSEAPILTECLNGWRDAGATQFSLYDYGNYLFQEAPIFWFSHTDDVFKALHERWGFRYAIGETSNMVDPSFMWYYLRAQRLWNTDGHWETDVRRASDALYGEAAEDMFAYFSFMQNVILNSDAGQAKGYSPLAFREFSATDLAHGSELLQKAWARAEDDPLMKKRLAGTTFGHAVMTYAHALKARDLTMDEREAAVRAHQRARDLSKEYHISLSRVGVQQMRIAYLRPRVEETLCALPLDWSFRKDPDDCGVADEWFKAGVDGSWEPIKTDKAWTDQGHQYHGVAWYRVSFSLNPNAVAAFAKAPRPQLYFGAIDGEAEMYLDGTKFAEQKTATDVMWDRPFTVPFPEGFEPGGKHELVVRVKKDRQAAGIWRPVSVVRLKP